MNYPYIIIDDDPESVLKTKAVAESFVELTFLASANNATDALNLIVEHAPKIVFLEIDPVDKKSNLSLHLINDLFRYLKVIPKIIVTTRKKDLAFEAIKFEVSDYILKPALPIDFTKLILKLKKPNTEDEVLLVENIVSPQKPKPSRKPFILCIKSYGDHRYIDSNDICYFRADNNSTDIHLNNGEMITAFKTLKHFENVLSNPFTRIHNSYIVNRNYISRIHTGNSLCYIKNTSVRIPFSKSYKTNIDLIIREFSSDNHLDA